MTYYTPTPSEFHEGFEHEVYSNVTKQWFELRFMLGNYAKETRVKHLDYTDVKELGWMECDMEEYEDMALTMMKHSFQVFEIKKGKNRYEMHCVALEEGDRHCANVKIVITEPFESFGFNGYIKNKSELKKIMQQLRIIQ